MPPNRAVKQKAKAGKKSTKGVRAKTKRLAERIIENARCEYATVSLDPSNLVAPLQLQPSSASPSPEKRGTKRKNDALVHEGVRPGNCLHVSPVDEFNTEPQQAAPVCLEVEGHMTGPTGECWCVPVMKQKFGKIAWYGRNMAELGEADDGLPVSPKSLPIGSQRSRLERKNEQQWLEAWRRVDLSGSILIPCRVSSRES